MARYTVAAPVKGMTRYIGAALTPHITRPAGAAFSRGPIVGQPGTARIPAPGPAAVKSDKTSLFNVGVSYSGQGPDFILPSLYYQPGLQNKAPVSRESDNQMPVPAKAPVSRLVSKPYRARLGGQRQVKQPQVVQSWKGMV